MNITIVTFEEFSVFELYDIILMTKNGFTKECECIDLRMVGNN